MDVPVYNMKGVEVGKLTIDQDKLGGEVNAALIKQAYVRYHANQRQGSARTLNRHAVEGSTKKIYKQKGTGRARHGDKKVPQFRGGGHAFAKKRTREDFRLDMPKKMRRKANLNALLAKFVDNEVRVVDSLSMDAPKTKSFLEFLGALKIDRSALVAVKADNRFVRLSGRNVEDVTLCCAEQLNAFNLLNHRYLVITKADLQALLAGPSAQIDKSAKINPLGRVKKEVA
ncbi:MAG: 50S ribosomal protein L4 [Phycisphaerales bacterium]|nr:50S ribosomal protein L4 [Phycisphaerales bacterium]